MKKLLLALFIGLIIIVGCIPPKVIQKTDEPKKAPVDEVQSTLPVPWLQDNDPNIAVGDPLAVYTEYRIIVTGSIPVVLKEYRDGKLYTKDSAVVFDYSVPAMTRGKIIRIDKRFGKPVSFTVCFNEDGDRNYNHIFNIYTDKSFVMTASRTLLINDIEYKRSVLVEGNTRLCHLLYYPEISKGQSEIGAPATGVSIPIGQKPIK